MNVWKRSDGKIGSDEKIPYNKNTNIFIVAQAP